MADQPTAAPAVDGTGQQQPGFSIERIYIKDLSVENPGSPQSFQITEQPAVEIGLRTRAEQVGEDLYECVLTITVTATAGGKSVFLVEASQAGLFAIRGVPASDMQPVLAIHCPNVLFPYARVAVSQLVTQGGFPNFVLPPVDFDQLFARGLAQQGGQAGTQGAAN